MLRARSLGAPALLLAAGVASGCSAEEPSLGDASAAYAAELDEARHVARVHLIIQPEPDALAADPALEITARFIQFRGFDPSFVRASFDLQTLAHEQLSAGTCATTESLLAEAELALGDEPADAPREILLLDAGNIRVQFGELRLDLALSLIPDLLPYVAGVEYVHTVDALDGFLPGDEVEAIAIEIEGAGDDELPGFTHHSDMPAPLELRDATGTFDRDALTLRWRPSPRARASDPPLTLRLTSYSGSEPTGVELTCVFPDTGEARLELDALRSLGLGGAGDTLNVVASRVVASQFEAGAFSDGEIIVELRDSHVVRLP